MFLSEGYAAMGALLGVLARYLDAPEANDRT
jgi:hypothetical protein